MLGAQLQHTAFELFCWNRCKKRPGWVSPSLHDLCIGDMKVESSPAHGLARHRTMSREIHVRWARHAPLTRGCEIAAVTNQLVLDMLAQCADQRGGDAMATVGMTVDHDHSARRPFQKQPRLRALQAITVRMPRDAVMTRLARGRIILRRFLQNKDPSQVWGHPRSHSMSSGLPCRPSESPTHIL